MVTWTIRIGFNGIVVMMVVVTAMMVMAIMHGALSEPQGKRAMFLGGQMNRHVHQIRNEEQQGENRRNSATVVDALIFSFHCLGSNGNSLNPSIRCINPSTNFINLKK